MKKFLTLMMTMVFFFACFCVSAQAATSDDVIMPRYNIVSLETTTFVIDSNGNASLKVLYRASTTGSVSARITSKIQKNESGTWVDVDINQPNNEWIDESTMPIFVKTHNHQLTSRGTYRAVVVYEISGTGGATDVIERTIEKTY